MPRYLFNPATNYGSSGGGGVIPVLLGGTGATTADGAATNLGFLKSILLGVANGVASLDANAKLVANVDWSKISSGKPTTLNGYGITDGLALSAVGANSGVASLDGSAKIPLAQMPSGLGTSITGPTSVYVGQVVNYTINAFSTFATYTITAIGGTFTRTDATITFTTTASAGGAASITINGAVHTLTVLASSVVAPTVTSPANAATNVSLVPTFTSSAFAYLGLTQTQDSVRWEISTSTVFSTTVQTYEGASNLTSWTPTSLSVNTTYYVRVRHHSSLGGWSAWSAVVSFSTIASYGWAARLNSTSSDDFYGVTSDTSGNIYTAGMTGSTPMLAKWDSSGNIVWKKELNGSVQLTAITSDSSGNVYAVGSDNTTRSGYSGECYLCKLDSTGSPLWQRCIGNSGTDYFNAVTTDSSGNIYAAGYVYNGSNYNDCFVTKWNASGTLIWQYVITDNTANHDQFNGIACDSSGNVYCVGYIVGSSLDYFICKFSSSGSLVWQRKLYSGNNDIFYCITIDGSNNIYVGGRIIEGASSPFITKWDSSGNLVWQRKVATVDNGGFYGLTCDASGNVYAAGKGYLDFDTTLVTKWDASGNLVWQKSIAASYAWFNAMTLNSTTSVVAVGAVRDNGGDYSAFITKWPLDATPIANTSLSGSGMTDIYLYAPTKSAATTTLSTQTTSLTTTATTFTVSTPTFSTTDYGGVLTRYFSTF